MPQMLRNAGYAREAGFGVALGSILNIALALIRHVAIIIPVMLVMNYTMNMDGLTWSQVVSDGLNVLIAGVIFYKHKPRVDASGLSS